MKIRGEQMQAFRQDVLRNFENEMLAHLRKFAPHHSRVIEDDGVLRVIRLGMERAEKHGFTNRGPVRSYLEMMFMFGSDFDTDPQYPWTAEILGDESTPNQMQRAERLYKKTLDYLDYVNGPDRRFALAAIRAAKEANARADEFELSPETLPTTILQEMKRIYPEKCEYVGDGPLETLVERGIAQARSRRVTVDRAVAYFPALMFAMGHGFAGDPLFPWVSKTLDGPPESDPNERVQRLHAKVVVYLDAASQNLEKR